MDWPQIVLGTLNAVIVGMTALLGRSLRKMRHNDLDHIQRALDRIEDKLDAHIQHHLDKGL